MVTTCNQCNRRVLRFSDEWLCGCGTYKTWIFQDGKLVKESLINGWEA